MMTRIQLFTLVAALTASIGVQGAAQTKMSVRSDSKLVLDGGSNVHDWSCQSSTIDARIEMDATYESKPFTAAVKPISSVTVVIPVRSLKCGHGKMDDNMYKALDADRFPEIRYVLGSYTLDRGATSDTAFVANTVGDLSVSGKTIRVEMPISATRSADGAMVGAGSIRMKMTDVGIKPPTAMFGALRTKDDIAITFTILLDKATAVALSRQ